MGKRKICKIVETGLQLTSVTSLAIGCIPSIVFEDYNKTTFIVGAAIGAAAAIGSIVPHNILYRLYKRDEVLNSEKNSETYKRTLEKDIRKMDDFGMFLIYRTMNWKDTDCAEIYSDYDLDMEILEYKQHLLSTDDDELIDFYYDHINDLESQPRSKEYTLFKDQFYKKKDSSIIEFRREQLPKENKSLKLVNKKETKD